VSELENSGQVELLGLGVLDIAAPGSLKKAGILVAGDGLEMA